MSVPARSVATNSTEWNMEKAAVLAFLAFATFGILGLGSLESAWLFLGWLPWCLVLMARASVKSLHTDWARAIVLKVALSWALTMMGLFVGWECDVMDYDSGHVPVQRVGMRVGLPWPGVVGTLNGAGGDALPFRAGVDAVVVNLLLWLIVVMAWLRSASAVGVKRGLPWVLALCCVTCAMGGWRLIALFD